MTEVLDRESLKALSTETRQDIIKHLSKRPYTASELAKIMNKHVTTISEHLSILEKSGLIQRKQSKNKWVYYALTTKGEKLFKPNIYTWVVVLSLSLLCLFGGLYSIFSIHSSSFSAQTAEKAEGSRELIATTVNQSAPNNSIAYTDYTLTYGIGIILIIVAIVGIGYLIYKKREQKIKIKI